MKIYIEKNDVLYPVDAERLATIISPTPFVKRDQEQIKDEIEMCLHVIVENEARKQR